MEIKIHQSPKGEIAEIISGEVLVKTSQDGLDLLVNVYYQNIDKMILYEQNLSADFFDLKTGLAGEVLQKFSNYRVKLAIVGDFNYSGKSIKDFIFESNKLGQINFTASLEFALASLS